MISVVPQRDEFAPRVSSCLKVEATKIDAQLGSYLGILNSLHQTSIETVTIDHDFVG